MSQVTVFQCDGPACLKSSEVDCEDDLMPDGWLILYFIADEEDRQAHLCSYDCLETWAEENT